MATVSACVLNRQVRQFCARLHYICIVFRSPFKSWRSGAYEKSLPKVTGDDERQIIEKGLPVSSTAAWKQNSTQTLFWLAGNYEKNLLSEEDISRLAGILGMDKEEAVSCFRDVEEDRRRSFNEVLLEIELSAQRVILHLINAADGLKRFETYCLAEENVLALAFPAGTSTSHHLPDSCQRQFFSEGNLLFQNTSGQRVRG